jgi:hypothetical protein
LRQLLPWGPATPEMAEIFDFFTISRMPEKHWHPPKADCLFFGTCDHCDSRDSDV